MKFFQAIRTIESGLCFKNADAGQDFFIAIERQRLFFSIFLYSFSFCILNTLIKNKMMLSAILYKYSPSFSNIYLKYIRVCFIHPIRFLLCFSSSSVCVFLLCICIDYDHDSTILFSLLLSFLRFVCGCECVLVIIFNLFALLFHLLSNLLPKENLSLNLGNIKKNVH